MRSVIVQWVVGFKQYHWISEEIFQNILHIQTYNWTMYALFESTLSGGLQAETMVFRRNFSKPYIYSNIKLNKVCALWKYSEWWASSRFTGFQKKFFKTFYTFKHTIEQCMRSVKVHWVVGFKQKQWLSEEVFQNNIHIQTYSWTKYARCGSTLCGGLQGERLAFRRSCSRHYTHSNIQLNNVCALWKYIKWLPSSRSNGFQKNFFHTLYTFKHTIEQCMRSVKVHWVVGFKRKQWFSEEVFQNIIHIQTYNWTKSALCESTVSGGLQAEALGFRRGFSKQYKHSDIQLNKVWALWKYSEWWASSSSNGFQRKFLKTLYTFKHTFEQCMRSVKVHCVVGFKQKQCFSEEVLQKQLTHSNIQLHKVCVFRSTLSGGLQAQAMTIRRSFSKH